MYRSIVVAALALSAAAHAQTYVATTQDGVPYPALTAATPLVLVTSVGTPEDRGRAQRPLGFSFPFFDRVYTQAAVTANGVVFLEPSSSLNLTSDFPTNLLGSVAEPNAVLAPFWDDLEGNNASSVVQTQPVIGANGNGLAIEFKDWNRKFGTYVLNFQVRLWANGVVEYFFGTMTGTGSTVSASCGIEAPGTAAPVQCPCVSNNNCQLTDLPTGRRITFGPAPGADLLARSLNVDAIVPSGGNLTVTATLALRNFGTVAATNFTWRLYLSDDTFYSPGTDVELLPGPQGPLTLNPLGELSSQVTASAPAPVNPFYVLAVIDDGNVVAESNELNNLAATSTPFSPGVDLVAQQILGPLLGGPGENITNTLVFSNQGVDTAGTVPYKIWLSQDGVLGVGDINVHSGTLPVAGGQNVSAPVTYALPTNVPAGDYTFILQLDDGPTAGVIAETSDTNNVAVGTTTFTARQADLVVDAVTVKQPLPPWVAATMAFFGEPIRVEVTVRNEGGATAPTVSVLAFLSDNDTLNAITDTFLGEVSGLSLAPGQSMTIDIDQPVPLVGASGQTLATGQYFFFGAAVGQGLVEASGTNNFLKASPIHVRTPAPDLAPLLVMAPAQVGQDERVVVTRTLANIGNRPAPAASYRYYLSANPIITVDDVALNLIDATGNEVASGSVTLGLGERSIATEILHVPAGVGLGAWYLGVLIDPQGLLDEIDTSNNGFSNQQVTVVGRGLAVSTTALPSAILGASYDVALAASGGNGAYAWQVRAGTSAPPGLAVTGAGRLQGTPTTSGVFGLDVEVSSGGVVAEAVLVVRVAPLTGSLGVATVRLPAVPRFKPYEALLTAVGGRAPWSWSLAEGTLPEGLGLDGLGHLAGTSSAAIGSRWPVRFRVIDAVGNIATQSFELAVIDPTAVRISAVDLPLAVLGSEYTVDVLATVATGTPLQKPLTWRLVGALPSGIDLLPSADERLLLSGTPAEVGAFDFVLEVQDATGRSDTRELLLLVVPHEIGLTVDLPSAVGPGDAVLGRITATPTVNGARFVLRDGAVPQGLVLAEDGTFSGILAGGVTEGTWGFTVAYRQGTTDLAFRTVALNVNVAAARKLKGCGCASLGSGELLAALWALAAFARRRTRFSARAS